MRFLKCKFEFDRWGLYLTPLIGFSWNPKDKAIWLGWLWFLWKIEIGRKKESPCPK